MGQIVNQAAVQVKPKGLPTGAFGIYVSLLLGLVKRCIIGYIFNKPISSLHEKDPVI